MENIQGTKSEFIKLFKELCYGRTYWQVWADLISTMACSLANVADKAEQRYKAREKEYKECIERLGGVEKPAQCLAIVVQALEKNPNQDFLGSLYMELDLGSHWTGQFFTPYHVSEAMSKITMENCKSSIEEKGWISVCDPCVGGGAMLIAAANTVKEQGINYQERVLFVGQDIDRIVGMMAYIQLTLLGCAGYIVIANTLTNPLEGPSICPNEKEDQEFWYTPFYFFKTWALRREYLKMKLFFCKNVEEEKLSTDISTNITDNVDKITKNDKKYMFFMFD